MAVTINGASTYTGGTFVANGGTLVVGSSTALGTGMLTMGQVFTDHTTLVLDGNGLNIGNTIVINSDPVVTVAAGTTNTISGPISGAGDIVLNGGGTLILSGANTYTSGTTICGTACGAVGGSSVLQVGVDTVGTVGALTSSAIGTGTLTFDGGTLQAGGNYTIANTAQISATGASTRHRARPTIRRADVQRRPGTAEHPVDAPHGNRSTGCSRVEARRAAWLRAEPVLNVTP